MIKIGLTGNIGSGKTTVAKIFETLGVPVFYADIEAKQILNKHSIIQKLSLKFGDDIIDTNQKIDRTVLASIVFKKPEDLAFLNGIIHPEVANEFRNWAKTHQKQAYIIQEAAILFESGFHQYMDQTIYVCANQDLRLKRILKRDQLEKNEISARMKNQWKDAKKIKMADHLISNNETDFLIPQILTLHKILSDKA